MPNFPNSNFQPINVKRQELKWVSLNKIYNRRDLLELGILPLDLLKYSIPE